MRLAREWKAKEDSLFTRNAEKENGLSAEMRQSQIRHKNKSGGNTNKLIPPRQKTKN